MRHYVSLQEKQSQSKNRPSALTIPLWVWVVLIAGCMLVVLALR